jgi:hypothetical protein
MVKKCDGSDVNEERSISISSQTLLPPTRVAALFKLGGHDALKSDSFGHLIISPSKV